MNTAIKIVGKHVNFWDKLHRSLEAELKRADRDQKRLVEGAGVPLKEMLDEHKTSWLKLEKQFDRYASLVGD